MAKLGWIRSTGGVLAVVLTVATLFEGLPAYASNLKNVSAASSDQAEQLRSEAAKLAAEAEKKLCTVSDPSAKAPSVQSTAAKMEVSAPCTECEKFEVDSDVLLRQALSNANTVVNTAIDEERMMRELRMFRLVERSSGRLDRVPLHPALIQDNLKSLDSEIKALDLEIVSLRHEIGIMESAVSKLKDGSQRFHQLGLPAQELLIKDWKNKFEKLQEKILKEEFKEYEHLSKIKPGIPIDNDALHASVIQASAATLEEKSRVLPRLVNQLKNAKEHREQHSEGLTRALAELKKATSSNEERTLYLRKLHEEYEKREWAQMKQIRDNKGFQDCGMSVAELAAIAHYTGFIYTYLNRALRNGGTDEQRYQQLTEVLNSSLKKLNPYVGTVRRGAYLPEAVDKLHVPGKVVTYDAFTSTSLGGGFRSGHQFIIQSKTGRYIAPLSNAYNELEVLFPPKTQFKILSREQRGDRVEIVMEEVTP